VSEVSVLTPDEARSLIDWILMGVDFVEDGAPLDPRWADVMRSWCIVLIDRVAESES
jgi:hypothetical protein